MIHRLSLGRIPAKPHTAMYEDGRLLREQMITRQGFEGPFTMLYYRNSPTAETAVERLELPGFCPHELLGEQPLRRRHIRTQNLAPAGDFLSGRRTLCVSEGVDVGVCKPCQPTRRFFSNGDGDECYFVTEGAGRVESLYGVLPFRTHDYLLIPKGTPYRLVFDNDRATLLVFEGRPWLGVPGAYRNSWGQLSDFAPYSHRDFRVPTELLVADPDRHGGPPYELVVKCGGELTLRRYAHFPFEVVGWDGVLYPVAFSIHDYEPKTGLVHLPPTIHTTFAGERFVICSFVPRLVDYHEKAIPCPYDHASLDMDEILYYVQGNFTSRKGIDAESISLHPLGVTHGAHPGMYEKSIGTKRTDELAVMCDAYTPFRMTTVAAGVEDARYHESWIE
ncbi:MAG: homogentisate 1,2-dioxygenase [Phycisphaerae bacterium]|jgi:homogentisate 1,2-dioxygenase